MQVYGIIILYSAPNFFQSTQWLVFGPVSELPFSQYMRCLRLAHNAIPVSSDQLPLPHNRPLFLAQPDMYLNAVNI